VLTLATQMSGGGDTSQHLNSLVLQSKKALQHGKQLCTHARAASNASAQAAIDVLALDAKIRWVVEAMVEQLRVSFFYFSIPCWDFQLSTPLF